MHSSCVRTFAGLIIALTATQFSAFAQSGVRLNATASPATGQPGLTSVTLTGTGFPAGTINAEAVTVTLAPAVAGTGPTAATKASSVVLVAGTTRRVGFLIPAAMVLPSPAAYNVTIAGSTVEGTAFNSTSAASLTINPAASISALSPATGAAGAQVSVAITGSFTNFLQGVTRASFGAGISVGGAPPGEPGPVAVTSPTTATATLSIAQAATAGPRDVSVATAAQVATLTNGFTITAGGPAPGSVVTLAATTVPATAPPGIPMTLAASGFPTETINAAAVNLVLAAATDGAGPAINVAASSITGTGSERIIGFSIPETFSLSRPIAYLISVAGKTASGGSFSSGNRAAMTLTPRARIAAVTPNVGKQGEKLTVTINGEFTAFAAGQTQVSFGNGIRVGSAAEGALAPVTVISPTTITAEIQISPGAAVGPRPISVLSSGQQIALADGFSVAVGQTTVSFEGVPVPAAAAPGSTVQVNVSNMPLATIVPGSVLFRLEPVTPGSGQVVTASAATVGAPQGNSRNLTFVVPAGLTVAAPVAYKLSVSGTASDGAPFASEVPVALTITPAAAVSLAPNQSPAGQTLTVAITGQFTSFQQGVTTAEFGPGIAVGGAATGAPGPVTVTSPTTATAQIVIAQAAAPGPRTVRVITGGVVTLASFSVTAGSTTFALMPAVPDRASPGMLVTLTGNGLPAGTVAPAQVQVALDPASTGAGPKMTVVPDAVTRGLDGSIQFTFRLPRELQLSLSTPNVISVKGSLDSGQAFTSSNTASITLIPLPMVSVDKKEVTAGEAVAVTITGQFTNFQQGVTRASFGAGIQVGGAPAGESGPVTVSSPTTAVAQISVLPVAFAGARTLTVTTGTEVATLDNAIAVSSGAPSLVQVSPPYGLAGQTLAVTITGRFTTFSEGVTQASFGPGVRVGGAAAGVPGPVTVVNATTISANLTIEAAAGAGVRSPVVITGAQQLTLPNGFEVKAGVPALVSAVPNSGKPGDTVVVAVTGLNTHFQQNATLASFGPGTAVLGVQVASPTQASIQVAIRPDAAAGSRTITLSTGAETVLLPNGFTIASAPALTAVMPTAGAQGQTLQVALTGQQTAFAQGITTVGFGAGIVVQSVAVTSPTSAVATIVVSATAAAGPRDVTVITGNQTVVKAAGFNVTSGAPGIVSVAPNTGSQGQVVVAQVVGRFTNFQQGVSEVTIDGAGVVPGAVTVADSTHLSVVLNVSAIAPAGDRTLSVRTGPLLVSMPKAFRVVAGTPRLQRVAPKSVQPGQTVNVSVTGMHTGFVEGTTRASFGPGISVGGAPSGTEGPVIVNGPGSFTAQLTVDPVAAAGPRKLVVSIGEQKLELADAFAVEALAATSMNTSPARGEGGVALTRETTVRFSNPLAANAVVDANNFYGSFAGSRLPARIEVSSTRKEATLFYDTPLPASARIRVFVHGDLLRDNYGRPVDADGDGQPGGTGVVEFDTISLTTLPATKVCGNVFASEQTLSGFSAVDRPLAGVRVTVDGAENTLRATTDASGAFCLDPAPVGRFFVHIDGRTATAPIPAGAYYPVVGKAYEGVAGKTVTIPHVYLPLIQPNTLTPVSNVQTTRVKFPPAVIAGRPELADVAVVVPPNSLYADNGSRGGRVGIAPVPPDRIPSPLPPGLNLPLVITIQTDGPSNFDQPVPACFPNLPDSKTGKKLQPGDKSALWSFNHDTGNWEIAGPMTVSGDGRLVCSDPGFGVLQPGWHGAQPGSEGNGGDKHGEKDDDDPEPEPDDKCSDYSIAWRKAALHAVAADMTTWSGTGTPAADHLRRFLSNSGGDLYYGPGTGLVTDLMAPHPTFEQRYRATDAILRARAENAVDSGTTHLGDFDRPVMDMDFYDSEGTKSQLAGAIGGIGTSNVHYSNIEIYQSDGKWYVKAMARHNMRDNYTFDDRDANANSPGAWAKYLQDCGEAKPFFTNLEFHRQVGPIELIDLRKNGAPAPLKSAVEDPAAAAANSASGPQLIQENTISIRAKDRAVVLNPGQPTRSIAASVVQNESHYYMLQNDVTGEVVQRGMTSNASVAHASLILAPNTRYKHWLLQRGNTPRVGYVVFTTPDTGRRFKIPATILRIQEGADRDGDGLGDAAENIAGTDPLQADTGATGIGDLAKIQQGLWPATGGLATFTGLIGSVKTEGNAVDVVAYDHVAAVAEGSAGVEIFNVSEARNPTRIAAVNTPGSATAVALDGALAAVADGASGLAIVSTGADAKVLRQVDVGGTAQAVVTAGGVAYVGLSNGLYQLVSVDLETGSVLDRLAIGSGVEDVAISGSTLYVLSLGKLRAIPLGEGNLQVASTVDSPGSRGAGGRRLRLFAGDGTLYATHTQGYNTFNTANPLQPVLIAAGQTQQFGWKQIVDNGSGTGVAAVSPNSTNDGAHDVSLYNTLNPSQTNQFLTTFTTPGLAASVTLYNGLAYVADTASGLQILNYLPVDTKKVPPAVELMTNFSENRAEENKLVAVRARATDDVQVRDVQLFVNGQPLAVDGNYPFEFRFVSPRLSQGSSFTIRACASDTGGNRTCTPDKKIDVVKDATPPMVKGVTPAAGSNAPANSVNAVTATVSEPLKESLLTTATFRLVSAGADGVLGTGDDTPVNGGSVSFRSATNTVVLAFGESLASGSYRATISGTVEDLAGNKIGADYRWNFDLGAVTSWVGPASGSWHTGANWSRGVVPKAGDLVVIDKPVTVTITTNAEVHSLVTTPGSTLALSGGVFNLSGNGDIGGTLQVSGGALEGPATVNIAEMLKWTGGSLRNGGAVRTVNAEISGTGNKHLSSRSLVVTGQATHSAGRVYLDNAATVEVAAGAVWDITGDTGLYWNGGTGMRVIVAGTLRKSGGTGSSEVGVALVNNGRVETRSGTFEVGGGSSTGRFITDAGSRLVIGGGGTYAVAGFEGAGAVRFNGTTTVNGDGAFPGPVEMSTGTVTFEGDVRLPGTTLISGGAVFSKTASMETLKLAGDIGGAGAATVSKAMTWSSGSMKGGGSLQVLPGASLEVKETTARFLSGRTLIVDGAATQTAGTIYMDNAGTLKVGSTGVWEINGDADLRWNGGSGMKVEVAGLLRKSAGKDSSLGVQLVNTGRVEVNAGALIVGSAGTSTGAFAVDSGARLSLGGGGTYEAAKFEGAGMLQFTGDSVINGDRAFPHTVEITSGTVTFNGNVTLPGTLRITSGGAAFNAGGTLETLDLAGEISGNGAVLVNNKMIWNSGSLKGTGSLRIAPGASLEVKGSSARFLTRRTLQVDGTATQASGRLYMDNGSVIVVSPGGVWDVENDSDISWNGGTGMRMDVAGTLRKSGGTAVTSIGIQVNNTGRIEVKTGSLAISGLGENTGTFEVEAGAVLGLGKGGTYIGENLRGAGTIRFDGDSVVNGDRVFAGPVDIKDGAVTFNGSVTIAGNLNITGTAVFNAAATLESVKLTGGIGGTGTVSISNAMVWNSGSQTGTGTTRIAPGAKLELLVNAHKALSRRTLLVEGQATQTGTTLYMDTGAVLRIASTGSWVIPDDSNINWNGGTGMRVDVEGALRKTGGTGETTIGVLLNNTGTVELKSGILRISSVGTATGVFHADPGTQLILGAGGTYTNTQFTGSGLLRFDGNATVEGDIAFQAPIDIRSGEVRFTGNATAASVDVYATIAGPGTLNVTGGMRWHSGSLREAGNVRIAPSATLQLTGANQKHLSGRTLTVEGSAAQSGGSLYIDSAAVLRIAAGAVWDIADDRDLAWNGGTNMRVEVAGTLRKSGGSGTTTVGIAMINSGRVEVKSGTLSTAITGVQTGVFRTEAGTRLILAGGGTYTPAQFEGDGVVQFNGNATVTGTGSFSSPVEVTSGDMNVQGDVAFRVLSLSADVDGPGTATVTETMRWTSGAMRGAGTFRIGPAAKAQIATTSGKSVSQRRLVVQGDVTHEAGSVLFSTGGTLDVAAGALWDLTGTSANVAWNGGTGMRVDVAGTLRNSAAGTQSIGIPVNVSGVLDVRTGTLSVAGLTVAPTGTVALTLGAPAAGTQFSRVDVNGAASLAGTLQITPANGYVPTLGTSFEVMKFNSRSGAFDQVTTPGITTVRMTPSATSTALTLMASSL